MSFDINWENFQAGKFAVWCENGSEINHFLNIAGREGFMPNGWTPPDKAAFLFDNEPKGLGLCYSGKKDWVTHNRKPSGALWAEKEIACHDFIAHTAYPAFSEREFVALLS